MRLGNKTRGLTVVLAVAALLGAATTSALGGAPGGMNAKAGPVVGPEVRVSGNGANSYEYRPAVAADSARSRYLVVWHDYRNGVGEIYGRWLDDLGTPLGAGFRISPASTWEQESPAVAFSPAADEYLVVWSRRLPSWEGDTCDIYGRRVAGAGGMSAAFRISGWDGLQACESSPTVAYGGLAQDYLVVWQDGRNAGGRGLDIYGRRVGAAGPAGDDFRISGPGATADEGGPAVAWNSFSDEFLVVWQDERKADTRATDIYGRTVPGSGAIAEADFRISGVAATAGEGPPSVAATQMSVVIGGGWLVVWSDGRNWLDRGRDVYGRRVDSQLGAYGKEYRISGPNAYDDDDLPVVASDPGHLNDDMMVVWQTNITERIRGRQMWAGGGPAYPEFAISGPNAEFGTASASPAIAYSPFDLQYLVVWTDWRRAATVGSEIYGRYAAG